MTKIDVSRFVAGRMSRLSASSIREICKLAGVKGLVSLAGGWPNPDTFPYAFTKKTVSGLMRERSPEVLQYGMSEGLIPLRQWFSGWLNRTEGVEAGMDELVITAGSQNAMELTCRVLVDEGDLCLADLPTYFGGVGSMQLFGGRLVGVPTDGKGARVDEMERILSRLRAEGRKVKLYYLQSLYHNPLGVNLAEERKQVLLDLAREYDFLIMEDNPYGDLCYVGKPQKPLKSMDREDRVVYIKSFAKIFAPGLRMAVVAAAPEIAARMVVARQYVDCCPANLNQFILYEFCKSGMIDKHIRKVRRFYAGRMRRMGRYIKEYFPEGVRWTRPKGGLFYFLYLPEHVSAADVLARSMEQNVAFIPGKQFFIDGSGANTMRLSFAQVEEDKMEQAVATIGRLIR
jgi:2-aminoadipate transaminase